MPENPRTSIGQVLLGELRPPGTVHALSRLNSITDAIAAAARYETAEELEEFCRQTVLEVHEFLFLAGEVEAVAIKRAAVREAIDALLDRLMFLETLEARTRAQPGQAPEAPAVVDDLDQHATSPKDSPPSSTERRADGPALRAAANAARRAALHRDETPRETAARATLWSNRVRRELLDNGDLLSETEYRAYRQKLAAAEKLPDASERAETLFQLSQELRAASDAQLQVIGGLVADFERVAPLARQAIALLAANPALARSHGDFEARWKALSAAPGGAEPPAETDQEAAQPTVAPHNPSLVERARDQAERLGQLSKEIDDILSAVGMETKVQMLREGLNLKPGAKLDPGANLGSGRFASVVELGVDQAGKALVGKVYDRSTNLQRFLKDIAQEEQVYARLGSHPNIARCYGVHEVDGQPALVMEKVEGPKMNDVFIQLEERYRSGAVNRSQYLGAMQQLLKGTLQGLAHFQACGMTHRDVKGDNLIFDTATLQPKLVDMGLSQAHGRQEKPENMKLAAPPEALYGSQTVDEKWDTFAVGKMVFPFLEQGYAVHVPAHFNEHEPHYQFAPGLPAAQAMQMMNGVFGTSDAEDLAAKAMFVRSDGSIGARVDEHGEYVGQALHQAGKKWGHLTFASA